VVVLNTTQVIAFEVNESCNKVDKRIFDRPLQYTALFSQDQVSESGTQITQNGALTALLMKQLVFANNALQQQLLAHINDTTDRSGAKQVSVYDAYQFFNGLLQNPPESAYGANPSITGFSGDCCQVVQSDGCTTCPDPQPYFYFDGEEDLNLCLSVGVFC
jgi:hypothetical protein